MGHAGNEFLITGAPRIFRFKLLFPCFPIRIQVIREDDNPQPSKQPTLETGISDSHGFEPSVKAVIDAAPFFDIEEADARTMAREMAKTVTEIWNETLRQHGITGAVHRKKCAPAYEHDRMAIAFGL